MSRVLTVLILGNRKQAGNVAAFVLNILCYKVFPVSKQILLEFFSAGLSSFQQENKLSVLVVLHISDRTMDMRQLGTVI